MNRFGIIISLLVLLTFLSCSEKEVSNQEIPQEIEYIFVYDGEEENPYTGKIIAKYENGQKKWEVNYEQAKKEGIQTDWYPNGEKMLEGMYEGGKRVGTWISWDENGNNAELMYKEGKEISSKESKMH